jgi:hypothetical protein
VKSSITSVVSMSCDVAIGLDLRRIHYSFEAQLNDRGRRAGGASFHLDVPLSPGQAVEDLRASDHKGNAPSVDRRSGRFGPGTRLSFADLPVRGAGLVSRLSLSFQTPSNYFSVRSTLLNDFGIMPLLFFHGWPTKRFELRVTAPCGAKIISVLSPSSARNPSWFEFTEHELPSGSLSAYLVQLRRRRSLLDPLRRIALSFSWHELGAGVAGEVFHRWDW